MREIIFRAWDGDKYSIGKSEYFDDSVNFRCHHFDIDCDKPVLEQYTGLKDKHGKMIFEGDVVKHNNTHYTVEFSRTQLGFVCMDRKHKTRGGWPNLRDGQWMQNVSKYLEVIGNIHDQKEDV